MTFLDRETTKAAQETRATKDERGRRGKYETPDRPGTNLAYSMTGKRPEGAPPVFGNNLGAMIREAAKSSDVKLPSSRKGQPKNRRPRNNRPKGQRPERGAFAAKKPVQPTPEARKFAASMAHRIAKASKA